MSFRRKVYDKTGGFDSNYLGNGFRFETDFTFAVKKAGYKVIFDSTASLLHRYHQPGGAENHFLFSLTEESHAWHEVFFRNTWYFLRKWYSLSAATYLMYFVWREHCLNRAALLRGFPFLMRRHMALFRGLTPIAGKIKNDWRQERSRCPDRISRKRIR